MIQLFNWKKQILILWLGQFILMACMSMSITPNHHQGQVMGNLQAANAVGTLVGPLFGSIIAYYWNYSHILFINN